MTSNGITNRFWVQFRSVILWSGLAAQILALCLFSYLRLSAQDSRVADSSSAQHPPDQHTEPRAGARTRVAEGEYKVLSQAGIGSFAPAVYDFRETWTLWRVEDGTFEVSGTRSYRSPADEPHSDNFEARLSAGLSVTELKEFRRLRWRPDTGPLTCDFLPGKVACTANSKDKIQNLTLDVPVQVAAGLLWPISAFSLSSITRSASHDPKTITPVELLTFEEISGTDPVFTTTLSGYLKYLGREKLFLADREWLELVS